MREFVFEFVAAAFRRASLTWFCAVDVAFAISAGFFNSAKISATNCYF